MYRVPRSLPVFALLLAFCAQASETADRIRALVPADITSLSIEEGDGHIDLTGVAPGNKDIAALMRAIDEAQLGFPSLESIQREGGMSRFRLRVKLGR